MTIASEKKTLPSDPHFLDHDRLAKLGVKNPNRYDMQLQCARCGEIWTPQPLPDGRLPRGYWKCPNRCNW